MNNLERFFDASGIYDIHEITKGAGIKVMILDTGCEMIDEIDTEKIVYTYNIIQGIPAPYDYANHGTAITKLIQTVAPESELYVIKVLDDIGLGGMRGIDTGLALALNKDVDILCMSLGSRRQLSMYAQKTLQRLIKSGTIVTSAVGNANRNELYFPSAHNNVLSVGGLHPDLITRYKDSNYSVDMDVVALGENIKCLNNDGSYSYKSGTSMANAIVAGQLALMKSLKSDLKHEDILKFTSNEYRDLQTGLGYIDLNKFKTSL